MPPTNEEFIRLAQQDPTPGFEGLSWEDGTEITLAEFRSVINMHAYIVTRMNRRRMACAPQRKAMAILRSFLGPDHRKQLKTQGAFILVLPSGNAYRIDARRGTTDLVVRHGKHYFVKWHFCLHDERDDGKVPNADVALTHMLILLDDETEFLNTANCTRNLSTLWNGEYLRNLRRRA